jgi:Trk K+ transport system NAD-binding subunit
MDKHVILCGLGRVGWHVLDFLRAAGTAVVVIDNRCAPDDPRLAGVALIQGDCQKQTTLEKAGVAQARGVVVVLSNELASTTTALLVRRLNPSVRVVVRMFNQNLIVRLGSAVSNIVALSTSALAAPLLALIARTGAALGTFRLDDDTLHQIAELTVGEGEGEGEGKGHDSPLCGAKLSSLLERDFIVLAHTAAGLTAQLHQVDPEAVLQRGDRLVLCGPADRLAPLLAAQDEESLPEILWAGLTRRLGRVLWRALREVDLPVKICTSVLIAVIVISTLVFCYGVANETPADAFYRTISLMATGADMGGRDLPQGGWQKVFVSVLRLAGAALTAAFTAILTNYLLRAHLGGALEARRIPDGGHIIVCGIGNVGFRVVEELRHQGERVVAIERSADNPFIATARRQGIPVILGDATVPEVLRQAHAASARAVVAATSMELVNLEITLLVRELNPSQRVVLLMVDPQLAQTVREAVDVRLAVSIPALAAPAFVAALLGDRVRSVFLVAGKLLAVVDLVVQADNTVLAGHTVRALAVDYNFVPIRLMADGQVRSKPLNARLGVGDNLTVIIGLSDLQRLLRRELPPRRWAVDVTECPLTARALVIQLARMHRQLSPELTDEAIAIWPCRVGQSLTRGQAEDLMHLLLRERVVGKLVDGSGGD